MLINGQRCFIAVSKLFRFRSEINVEANNVSDTHFTIKQQWNFIGPNYSIQLGETPPVLFTTRSAVHLHFECVHGKDIYTLYGHKKRRYSVFKNGIQIAAWRHELVTWFDGDNYTIEAENECCKELITAFCLIIDNYYSNQQGAILRLNLFKFAWKMKDADIEWKPQHQINGK
ncbi:MAG: hypothetical protein RLZZ543_390 [Bacteroidota bacterium]